MPKGHTWNCLQKEQAKLASREPNDISLVASITDATGRIGDLLQISESMLAQVGGPWEYHQPSRSICRGGVATRCRSNNEGGISTSRLMATRRRHG
jgi:hypothetical protein